MFFFLLPLFPFILGSIALILSYDSTRLCSKTSLHTRYFFSPVVSHIFEIWDKPLPVLFKNPCTTSFVRQAQVSESSNHISQGYLIFKNVNNLFVTAVYLKL